MYFRYIVDFIGKKPQYSTNKYIQLDNIFINMTEGYELVRRYYNDEISYQELVDELE